MIDTYHSIAAHSEGLYKDRGSRFISLAYPVESETQVKEILDRLRNEYHDARHHCFAYRIGLKGEPWRCSDDGEPSGSSGRPILGQIDSSGLSDILVVVVRYFGGIKLGIPGLIKAYRTATAEAIAAAQIIEKVAGECYLIKFPYGAMNDVMKLSKDLSLPQKDQDFGLDCSMSVRVRLSDLDTFISRTSDIEGCTIAKID